jgi:hypothetical protein
LQRGEAALRQVLGTSSARFAVSRAMGPMRENLGGSLADLLANAARSMLAVEDSLVGTGLLEVARVEVEGDTALAYARTLAPRLSGLVARVMEGQSPRDLILRDGVAPAELEPVLVELARRGAVLKVLGARGEDLAALRATGTPSILPASVEPIERLLGSLAPRSEEERGRSIELTPSRDALRSPGVDGEASLADAVWNSLRAVGDDSALRARKSASSLPPAPKVEPIAEPTRGEVLAPLPEIDKGFEPAKTPSTPMPATLIDATRPSEEPEEAPLRAVDEERVVTHKVPSAPPKTRAPESVPPKTAATVDVRLHAGVPLTQSDTSITSELSREALDELKHNSVTERTPPRPDVAPTANAGTSRRPPALPAAALQARSGARPKLAAASTSPAAQEPPTSSPPMPPATGTSTPTRPTTPPPERSAAATTAPHTADEPDRSLRPSLLLLGIGFAFATSYYGVRWFIARGAPPPVQVVDVPSVPEPEVSEEPDASVTSPPTEPSPEATPDVARAAPAVVLPAARAEVSVAYEPASGWLQGATLPARSGVLVVRAPPNGEAITVQIDQRPAVAPPTTAVLPEGLHAVRLRSGANSRYQLATVRVGEAVVLAPPSGL